MAYYPLEAFFRVEYPSELTYDELLQCEAILIPELEGILAAYSAVHVDVVPDGDELRVQCVFVELADSDFEAMCRKLGKYVAQCSSVRILLLHKNLQKALLARFMAGQVRVEPLLFE